MTLTYKIIKWDGFDERSLTDDINSIISLNTSDEFNIIVKDDETDLGITIVEVVIDDSLETIINSKLIEYIEEYTSLYTKL